MSSFTRFVEFETGGAFASLCADGSQTRLSMMTPMPLRTFLRRLIWLCMLPLFLLVSYLGVQSVRNTRSQNDLAAANLATNVAQALDQNLNARIAALSVLAGSPLIADASRRSEMYQQAQAFRDSFGSDVVLADAQGMMLFNTRLPFGSPLPPLPRPSGSAAVPTAFATGKPAVGDTFLGPIAKVPLVAVAVPIVRDGRALLVLLTAVEAKQFQELLAKTSIPAGWSISLLDGKKAPIARSLPSSAPTTSPTEGGGRFTVASAASPWTVVLEIPRDRYRAPLFAGAWTLALFILAATLTGLLGGTLASRRLARSVASLADTNGFGAGSQVIAEVVAVRQRLQESAEQRQKAVTALRDSELGFKYLFDGIPDSIIVADPERQIRMVNPAFESNFGYAASDVIGKTTQMLYADPADYEKQGRERYDRSVTANPGSVYMMRYRRRDGSAFWAETHGVRIARANGEVVGLLGVHRDVSERMRAEASHRELNERFAKVFQTSPLGIAIGLVGDATFVDINPALEALLGYSRDEMIGRTGLELKLWVDREALSAVAQAIQSDGSISNVETQFRKKSGQIIDVVYAGCRVDIAGVPHFVGMADDITSEKQARRDQARHNELLETLVAQRTAELAAANTALAQRAQAIADLYDGAPCGYLSMDIDRTITEVNNTCLVLLGYARNEFVGQRVDSFMAPESQTRLSQRFADFLRTGQARDLEYEFLCKDGRTLPVLVNADIQRDALGAPVSARATVVDNGERTARERQIADMQRELARRADDAEAANRAKSAFLANMSHEIRTPMNAIIGLTHLLCRDAHDTVQRERIERVGDAGRHLLQVINDILDLSKIEAGKMELDDAEFSLDELLARSFEMVSDRAREKGLELVLDTDHLPDRLCGDATRLSQVLINLLANAVKFTERGWVRLRGQLLREEGRRLCIRFEVKDTGEGIAIDRQAELFNAFEQADRSSTRRHGGTGLGLALTRHLAKLMGGEAGVDSAPGSGSTFWFTAWLGRAGEAGEQAAPISLQGLRTLLVDDLPEARMALDDRLRLLGMQVNALPSGDAAIKHVVAELAAGRPYDVVLIDWRMGPPDGIETLRRLREILGVGMPRSILVTAFDEAQMWQQSRLVRCDAVLIKPVTASALHDTLVRVLRNQAAAVPAQPTAPGQGEALLRRQHAGQRVLLAEDNAINQEVAEELLRSAGLVVETAADGERAVELALSRHYDLLLLDLQMPKMDGLDATRAIRDRAGRGTPIVAMTANAFGEDRAACLAAGMNDHVAKPVNPEVLYATLLRWLPLRSKASNAEEELTTQHTGSNHPSLPERLAAVDGLDLADGLAHVGGQWSTLERVLRRFVLSYQGGAPELLSPATPEGVARWHSVCHSLRGASATIGATPLTQQLLAFERDLLAADDAVSLEPRAQQLHESLCSLVGRVSEALG